MKYFYLTWTLLTMIVVGLIASYILRPNNSQWILEYASFLKFVNRYSKIEPVVKQWQTAKPAITNIHNFWKLASERPYVYLPKESIVEFSNRFNPSGLKFYLQRVKTILISPCSFEKKRQIFNDPLMISLELNKIITPALTADCPVLYVCVYGSTKEECVINTESMCSVLEKLKEEQQIGEFQSLSTFIASKEKQSTQLAFFNTNIDTFQWQPQFERELEVYCINTKLFGQFIKNIKNMIDPNQLKLSVSLQEERLNEAGLSNLVKAFFSEQNYGYQSVCRVLPSHNSSVLHQQKLIKAQLDSEYIISNVGSPEYLVKKYHELGLKLMLYSLLLWGLGIGIVVSLKSIKLFFERIIFGSRSRAKVKFFTVDKDYKPFLQKLGFKKFVHYICYDSKLPQFANKSETMRAHKQNGKRPTRQIESLKLPVDELAPNLWQGSAEAIIYIKRGYGAKAAAIRNEYLNLKKMAKVGISVPCVVAYGEADWHAEPCIFMVLEHLKNYIPLDRWQAFDACDLAPADIESIKQQLIIQIGDIVKKCHQNNFFNVQLYAKHIFFKSISDGMLTVSLIDIEKVYQPMLIKKVLFSLIPYFKQRAIVADLALLNSHLFFNIWDFKNRLKIFKTYLATEKLSSSDKKLVSLIGKQSIRKGYAQYRAKKNKIFLNLSNYADMEPFNDWQFKDFMKLKEGRQITKKSDRTVFAFLKDETLYYIKRHYGLSIKESNKLFWENKKVVSNAWLEWAAMEKCEALGIATVPAVAMGEKFKAGREKESFLLTSELPAGQSVEEILGRGLIFLPKKRVELAFRIAKLVRKFHSAGLVHRDLYLGHIYVVGNLNVSYKLHLLDLQRVKNGAAIYNRWSIKDISALYFSTKSIATIRDVDRLRFLMNYLGVKKMDFRARQFLYRVMGKCLKIEKHTEKLLVRRRKRGELPPLG